MQAKKQRGGRNQFVRWAIRTDRNHEVYNPISILIKPRGKMDLVNQAKLLFGDCPRPAHFTNYRHCCECAEHDATLAAHNPETIGWKELQNPGWDPVCFATLDAFKYYFPALVRLAAEGTGSSYYLDQFLFHLVLDGPRNDRWKSFSREQREYVAKLLQHFLETRAEEIEQNLDADLLFQALEIWSEEA